MRPVFFRISRKADKKKPACKQNDKPTFNLPNFLDRYPVGKGSLGNAGTLLNQGLPNITGDNVFGVKTNGAFKDGATTIYYAYNRGGAPVFVSFDASRSSAVYGAATRVQPFSSVVNFCIRY